MSEQWMLYGSGRNHRDSWGELHGHVRGWNAAWSDNSGFHLGTMPERMPVTTHLWAWNEQQWLRVRIDGSHWWAALLTPGVGFPPSDWSREHIERPDVTPVRHWFDDDGRVQRYRGTTEVRDGRYMWQLVPLRRTTATFIADRDPRA